MMRLGTPVARIDRVVMGLGLVFALVFFWSLPDRLPHLDDAWFGEQALSLSREGVVRSELFADFQDHGQRLWIFHKGHVLQGALALWIGGWSLATLKAVSLPWFALVLVLLLWRGARTDGRGRRELRPLAAVLFLAHPLVVDYAYTFRPEMCLAALGLGCFLALERTLDGDRRWPLVLGALLAGLGVLVHLNGVIFVAAGSVLLFAARRRRDAAAFLGIATAIASLYLADALLAGEWSSLRAQFVGDPSLEPRDFRWSGALHKLAREPLRWFRHGEDAATAALVLLLCGLTWRKLWREERRLLLWCALLLVGLGLVAQSKTTKYGIPLLPPLFLLSTCAFEQVRSKGRAARILAGVLLCAFTVVALSRSQRYFSGSYDAAERHRVLLEDLPRGAMVATDLTFVFDEVDRHVLRGLWAYRVRAEAHGEELELAGLVQAAREDGVEFLVLDERRALPRHLARAWRSGSRPPGAAEIETHAPQALRLSLSAAE